RWYTPLGLAAVSTVGCYILLAVLGRLVPVPVLSGAGLLLIAAVLWVQGRQVRRLVAGERTAMTPMQAARVAVFAKAATLGGAAVGGYCAAQLILALENLQAPAQRVQAWASGGALGAAGVLVVVALVVESWCRLPPEDDDCDELVGER